MKGRIKERVWFSFFLHESCVSFFVKKVRESKGAQNVGISIMHAEETGVINCLCGVCCRPGAQTIACG